jgi:hypothetical protein
MATDENLLKKLDYLGDQETRVDMGYLTPGGFLHTDVYEEAYRVLSEMGFGRSKSLHPMLIMNRTDPPRTKLAAVVVAVGYATESEPLWHRMEVSGEGDLLLQCISLNLQGDVKATGHYSPNDTIDLRGRLHRVLLGHTTYAESNEQ